MLAWWRYRYPTPPTCTHVQTLQPLVDIQDTLSLLGDDHSLEAPGRALALAAEWRGRLPSAAHDDLPVWHRAVTTRMLCFDKIGEVSSSNLTIFTPGVPAAVGRSG